MEDTMSPVSGAVRSVHVYMQMLASILFISEANLNVTPQGRITRSLSPTERRRRRAPVRWVDVLPFFCRIGG